MTSAIQFISDIFDIYHYNFMQIDIMMIPLGTDDLPIQIGNKCNKFKIIVNKQR